MKYRTGCTRRFRSSNTKTNPSQTTVDPAKMPEGKAMGCSTCTNLNRALEARKRDYVKACSAALRKVTSRFVAYDVVEMERARSELDMHRAVCVSAIAEARGARGCS